MYVARRLDPWLFGVFYTDVRALVLGELVLIAATLLASLIPALRAARSNPVETLRKLSQLLFRGTAFTAENAEA